MLMLPAQLLNMAGGGLGSPLAKYKIGIGLRITVSSWLLAAIGLSVAVRF